MPDYKLYIVSNEGHFLGAIDLVCADDQAARAAAIGHLDAHDLELWQGERRVARLAPGAAPDLSEASRKKRRRLGWGFGSPLRLRVAKTP